MSYTQTTGTIPAKVREYVVRLDRMPGNVTPYSAQDRRGTPMYVPVEDASGRAWVNMEEEGRGIRARIITVHHALMPEIAWLPLYRKSPIPDALSGLMENGRVTRTSVRSNVHTDSLGTPAYNTDFGFEFARYQDSGTPLKRTTGKVKEALERMVASTRRPATESLRAA